MFGTPGQSRRVGWLVAAALLLGAGGLWHFLRPAAHLPSRDRASGPCGPARDLRPARPPMRGDDVWELQLRLRELGYYRGPLDGVFDEPTVQAVRSLQRGRGVAPTGRVTQSTWRLLADPEDHRPAAAVQAPPSGEPSIIVDINTQILTLFAGGTPYKQYTVAVGKPWTPSPPGEWRIVEKAFETGGAFGTRWLGLDVPWGEYGIHGTNRPWSIGRQASAGCIRMNNHDVEELFEWVRVGTPVTVIGPLPDDIWQALRRGSVGPEVVALQLALRGAGFPPGRADARFGQTTEQAVRRFETFYGLPADGRVGAAELYLLGLRRLRGDGEARGTAWEGPVHGPLR